MNKIFKYFMMVVVAIAGLSFASCSDDDDNYTVGEASDGAYLYSDFSSKTYLPDDTQAFTINLGRANASGEQTFQLKCDNNKFHAPTTVTFKAGESEVAVPVTFDIDLGSTETAQFTIPTDESSAYGDDTISVSITRDYTWENIGTAKFDDEAFTGAKATVYVAKAKEATGLYKFVAPMYQLYKQNGEANLPGIADFKFNMDEAGNITIDNGFYAVEDGTSLINDGNGGTMIYYDAAHYPQYCSITNENGLITINFVTTNGSKLINTGYWEFNWNKGYPYAE